jgi:hypothetical protein
MVLSFHQNLTGFVHHDRSEGMLTGLAGLRGQGEATAQIPQIGSGLRGHQDGFSGAVSKTGFGTPAITTPRLVFTITLRPPDSYGGGKLSD